MTIALPALPYDRTALEPHLSADTIDLHVRLQHGHVERANALLARTALADASLADIVLGAQGALHVHAAQIWNDDSYFNGLKPVAGGGGGEPEGPLLDQIARAFGDVARFRRQFERVALRAAGSGWVWLLQRRNGELAIAFLPNAACPLGSDLQPLLACCVWEHAYMLDYRHARDSYVAAFWQLVDWKVVASRMR